MLLRLKTEDPHGTVPLDRDITVWSLPLVPAVGIRWTTHTGRLRAVPTSRYCYLHPKRAETRSRRSSRRRQRRPSRPSSERCASSRRRAGRPARSPRSGHSGRSSPQHRRRATSRAASRRRTRRSCLPADDFELVVATVGHPRDVAGIDIEDLADAEPVVVHQWNRDLVLEGVGGLG